MTEAIPAALDVIKADPNLRCANVRSARLFKVPDFEKYKITPCWRPCLRKPAAKRL